MQMELELGPQVFTMGIQGCPQAYTFTLIQSMPLDGPSLQ
jgi:hypothetical protein